VSAPEIELALHTILIVDDEALARARLRTLVLDCGSAVVPQIAQAAHAVEAMELLQRQRFEVALLDIHMPGADGLTLARALQALPLVPALIFVTAHAEHAVQAFDLEAVDYLTKPVRLERLRQALQKAQRFLRVREGAQAHAAAQEVLLIADRQRSERIPLHEIIYFKAELKYITVRTQQRSYILDGALGELEEKYAVAFLRIHRNALVARRAIRALEKHYDPEEGEGWAVRLLGIDELLAVSRRQLAAVRALLAV
jgi:two-component system response regulator AlgR